MIYPKVPLLGYLYKLSTLGGRGEGGGGEEGGWGRGGRGAQYIIGWGCAAGTLTMLS